MRHLFCILFLILLASCASSSRIPLPRVTKYDDDPKVRAVYLRSFEDGYRAALEGHTIIVETPGLVSKSPAPRTEFATMDGFQDGQIAGHEARLAHDTKPGEKEGH